MQALYDFSPLVRMLWVGVLLALGPLTWVWYQHRRAGALRRTQALTLLTLFLTFDLLMFGAFTRLTDSGLGCPDWPGCYGQASPIAAHAEITAAQSAMPSGPVTHDKAWIEMVHRYLATSVGVLMMVLAVSAWLGRARPGTLGLRRAPSPWWPTLTLLWVCLQGAFGALTVTMKLFPAIVTLHLLGGMVLLALLGVQVARTAQLDAQAGPLAIAPGLRRLLWLCFAVLGVQIALGGWVSTNYAVLACSDFPLCQGSWWPQMDFQRGFELWRELGLTGSGEVLNFAALTAIHYVHRLAALIVLVLLGLLAWRLNRVPALRQPGRWLAALTTLQWATGLSNVMLDWPLLGAVLHTAGAGALVLVLTWAVVVSHPV